MQFFSNLKVFKLTAPLVSLLIYGCDGNFTSWKTSSFQKSASNQQFQISDKYKNTCYADALIENEGKQIIEKSHKLESTADKLAAVGKHKEAIRKYNEAGAAALNEAIANGSAEDMKNFIGDTEDFQAENRALIQRTAKFNFKIGQSYSQLGKLESALDCFNRTLNGILPPNDAIAYLNRGDVYERMGFQEKAKADFWQAANLFKKYKLTSYQKLAEARLHNL